MRAGEEPLGNKSFYNPGAQKRYSDAIQLRVKVGTWVYIPGRLGKCHHAEHDGKPFLLNEGLYDEESGKNILPGELPGCICTFRDFVLEFGDKATPEIAALLEKAESEKKGVERELKKQAGQPEKQPGLFARFIKRLFTK